MAAISGMKPGRGHTFQLRKLWLCASSGVNGRPVYYPFALHLNRAALLETTGEWEKAEKAFQDSADWCRQAGHRAELAVAITRLFRLRQNMGKTAGLLAMVTESLDISRSLSDTSGIIHGHINLGKIHVFEGRTDKAAAEYHTAIELAEHSDLERLLIPALGNLGQLQMLQGDYEQSIATNQRVLALSQKYCDEHQTAVAYLNMGNGYFFQSRYELALECYRNQVAQFRRSGNIHGYSVATGNIGNVYNITGDSHRAMECYREKLALSERLGFAAGIGQALGNIANLLLDAGDIDGAIACDTRMLAIAGQSGDNELLASGMIDMGELLLHKGDLQQSIELLDRAIVIARSSGMAYNLAAALVKRADAKLRLGDRAGARRDALEGKAAAERIGDKVIELEGSLFAAKAADGPAQGIAEIEPLIGRFPGDQQQASIFFELYGLTNNEQHRAQALDICRRLEQESPSYPNRQRIGRLERR